MRVRSLAVNIVVRKEQRRNEAAFFLARRADSRMQVIDVVYDTQNDISNCCGTVLNSKFKTVDT
jgi:hypothetical protein